MQNSLPMAMDLQRGSSESEEWIAKAGFRWKSMEEESEDQRKSIYISTYDVIGSRMSTSDDDCPPWYVIRAEDLFPSSSLPPQTEMNPSPITPAPIPRLPSGLDYWTPVVLYPRIYLIGGRFFERPEAQAVGVRSLYSYDMNKGRGWQKMKDMESPRISPCAFALDGKIYVFGELSCACCLDMTDPPWSNCYATKPYLEIYDPLTDTWEGRLHGACASLGTCTSRLSAHFEDCCGYRHVLFHTDISRLWTYNIDLDLLTCRDERFFFSYDRPTAVVDGILFGSNARGWVIGYDLTSPKLCGVILNGLTEGKEIPYEQNADVSLFGIGGNRLCITYPDEIDHVIFCSVVKVIRATYGGGERGLHAVVEKFKSYSYGGSLGCSMECLAF